MSSPTSASQYLLKPGNKDTRDKTVIYSSILFAMFLHSVISYAHVHFDSTDICEEMNRTDYYMCPLCDTRCDFWYLTDTCGFARVSLPH